MINKRLLIKNILSNNDECTFFDKKEIIDIYTQSGKSKLLKHICALSNSNPRNDSYLIVGVSDENHLKGTDFIDDADIQNLVSSNLSNPPVVRYESISFPTLQKEKVIGLLTISPSETITSFTKSIAKIKANTTYNRIGSKSEPAGETLMQYFDNRELVISITQQSQNDLQILFDGVFEFHKLWGEFYRPTYIIFKGQYVLCWSGYKGEEFHSEVDIQIINDNVRLFYSANTDVKIRIDDVSFTITEYVFLGFEQSYDHFPYESTTIEFHDNGTYTISKKLLFTPPSYPKEEIELLYKKSKEHELKISSGNLTDEDWGATEGIAMNFFLCYLNGISEAIVDFHNSINYLDGAASQWYYVCKRILEAHESNAKSI